MKALPESHVPNEGRFFFDWRAGTNCSRGSTYGIGQIRTGAEAQEVIPLHSVSHRIPRGLGQSWETAMALVAVEVKISKKPLTCLPLRIVRSAWSFPRPGRGARGSRGSVDQRPLPSQVQLFSAAGLLGQALGQSLGQARSWSLRSFHPTRQNAGRNGESCTGCAAPRSRSRPRHVPPAAARPMPLRYRCEGRYSARGAVLFCPLAGLTRGARAERLAWRCWLCDVVLACFGTGAGVRWKVGEKGGPDFGGEIRRISERASELEEEC